MPLRTALPTLIVVLVLRSAPADAFGFEDVSRRAQELAVKSYRPQPTKLPKALADISYDLYRSIRFKTDRSLWHRAELPFEIQFFHPGLFFRDIVRINLVTAQGVRPHAFDPDAFTYPQLDLSRRDLRKLGYAGFRIHYPINRPDYRDEIASFLGASYFRGIGRKQAYGLSARGLAVDTAAPSGEEFPAFREFWLEWPAPRAEELVVYALLDSPRVSGAYRFVIRPGAATVMEVRARLFRRAATGKLGLAPLTSMFFYGENQPAPREDYRPEVHDSDGLLIADGAGEWLWRPLVNPQRLLVTSFQQQNPRGFGLMQRDRAFVHYEDLEARYERRPSAWVEPLGDWGKGRIELVQIPSPNEFNDNVVAYWVPEQLPPPGTPLEVSYRLSWQMNPETAPPTSRVTQTRRGGLDEGKDTVRFVLDFEGPALANLPAADVRPVVWSDENGEVLEQRAYANDATGGWRMHMYVRRKESDQPVELRAFLRGPKDGAISETWSYVWPPT